MTYYKVAGEGVAEPFGVDAQYGFMGMILLGNSLESLLDGDVREQGVIEEPDLVRKSPWCSGATYAKLFAVIIALGGDELFAAAVAFGATALLAVIASLVAGPRARGLLTVSA